MCPYCVLNHPSVCARYRCSNLYWSKPAIYNRDRPVFKHYVPLLHRINQVGWRAITHARVELPDTVRHLGIGSNSRIFVERWGNYSCGDGGDTVYGGQDKALHLSSACLFFTVRWEALVSATILATLTVEASAVGLADTGPGRPYLCPTLSSGYTPPEPKDLTDPRDSVWTARSSDPAIELTVKNGVGTAQIPLHTNATLLFTCQRSATVRVM